MRAANNRCRRVTRVTSITARRPVDWSRLVAQLELAVCKTLASMQADERMQALEPVYMQNNESLQRF